MRWDKVYVALRSDSGETWTISLTVGDSSVEEALYSVTQFYPKGEQDV